MKPSRRGPNSSKAKKSDRKTNHSTRIPRPQLTTSEKTAATRRGALNSPQLREVILSCDTSGSFQIPGQDLRSLREVVQDARSRFLNIATELKSGESDLVVTSSGRLVAMPTSRAALYWQQRQFLHDNLEKREAKIQASPPPSVFQNAVLFTHPGNELLARKVAAYLGTSLHPVKHTVFSDRERKLAFLESVQGKDVFLIAGTDYPAYQKQFEIQQFADAARRSGAKEFVLVMPYFGFARQDKPDEDREPITAKIAIDNFIAAGVTKVYFVDVHSANIKGYTNKSVSNFFGSLVHVPAIEHYLEQNFGNRKLENVLKQATMVSPDLGAAKRARKFGRLLGVPSLELVNKERDGTNTVKQVTLIGDVKNKIAIIPDDIGDTLSTMKMVGDLVRRQGAKKVIGAISHAICSGNGYETLWDMPYDALFILDTVELPGPVPPNVHQISIAPVLGEAILRHCSKESVSQVNSLCFRWQHLALPYL